MRRALPAVLVSLYGRAAGHGILNEPIARNGVSCGASACGSGQRHKTPPGLANGGDPEWNGHSWFNNNVHFAGNATLTSKGHHALLTQCHSGGAPPDFADCDWTLHTGAPWRAPGTATVSAPCGLIGGKGAAGSALAPVPAANRSVWAAGGTAAVAWAIHTNHGGGYSYRLCPSAGPLTEACFQRTPLRFAGDTTDLVGLDGAVLHTIPAVRTTDGTHPPGSQWTRNPIPSKPGFFPPPFGISGSADAAKVNLLDRVQVPAGLAPGEYVLSWRWDCEQTEEVWANCGDVTIVAAR